MSDVSVSMLERGATRKSRRRIFDPIFDRRCRRKPEPLKKWKAKWIWYPGQLAHACHARAIRKTIKRCTLVGYPGRFLFRLPSQQSRYRRLKEGFQ